MIADYFTNYKHQLESYEASSSEKLTALLSFVSAVVNDWESVRKRRALMRLDETKVQVEEFLKRLNQSATTSEFIVLLPGDLPRLYNTLLPLIASLMGDSVPRPITSEEKVVRSFFQRPEVASILQRTFNNVRNEIETTLMPADMKASVYVDQKLQAELREALRIALPSDNGGRIS